MGICTMSLPKADGSNYYTGHCNANRLMILNFEEAHFGVKENAHSLRLRGLKKILIKSIFASLSDPAHGTVSLNLVFLQ